jgi:hypothetical protein
MKEDIVDRMVKASENLKVDKNGYVSGDLFLKHDIVIPKGSTIKSLAGEYEDLHIIEMEVNLNCEECEENFIDSLDDNLRKFQLVIPSFLLNFILKGNKVRVSNK